MIDYTKLLPNHIEKYIGDNDLFLEIFEGEGSLEATKKRPPLLFVHGAYSGSWMWSKYIPHFINNGWKCYAMNLRSHYKSRVLDLTKVSFHDYLEDIKEVVKVITAEGGEAPILIGHSMSGILGQKLAETVELAGLIPLDSSISKEVYDIEPFQERSEITTGIILPAPPREEQVSMDESEEDIIFQRKYLTMESYQAISEFAFFFGAEKGISIDSGLITCPGLVICAVNSAADDIRGKATADQLHAEYAEFPGTTHTGLLVGQRYWEVVDRILDWLKRF
jgi:pimeloyl-ACP methyl ester carboxylesterase